MDFQAIYQSVIDFWDNVSPILFAHLFLVLSWIWSQGKTYDFLGRAETALNSSTFRRWKIILDEFELMPKVPFILLLLSFFYLVALNNTLNFVAGGLKSPLSIMYTETDFWLETDDGGVKYDLMQLATYQGNPDARISDIYNFKTTMVDVYEGQYPNHYKSLINWIERLNRQWGDYYQVSYALFAFFLVTLIINARKKTKSFSSPRLFVLLVIILLFTFFARYQTEHYIEKRLRAELNFVVESTQADDLIQDKKLNQEQIKLIGCNLYNDRISYKHNVGIGIAPHHFWLSRFLEGFIQRDFPQGYNNITEIPIACNP